MNFENNVNIKEKLQKFFDKDISSICKKDDLYYVILDDGLFIKPVYETDINGKNIIETGIPGPVLEKMELVYSKFYNN